MREGKRKRQGNEQASYIVKVRGKERERERGDILKKARKEGVIIMQL